jgi:hypothetical protein
MKTRKQDWTALLSRLHELHPYDSPECVAVRIAAGAPKYMAWLDEALAPERAVSADRRPRRASGWRGRGSCWPSRRRATTRPSPCWSAASRLRSHLIAAQDVHRLYGGVVPELASRAHLELLPPLVERALAESGVDPEQLTAWRSRARRAGRLARRGRGVRQGVGRRRSGCRSSA